MKQDPQTPEICRPCMIGVTASWYVDELKERGLEEMASQFETSAMEADNPEAVGRLMDDVKEKVPEPVKCRLIEFDCTTQLNET